MFSENQIKEYKSISAPEELRQKVLSMKKAEKKQAFKVRNIGIYAAAACLVLVISLSGVFGGNDFSASFNGQKLDSGAVTVQTDSGIAMLDARSLDELSVDIEIETSKNAEIEVSDGSIQISDTETGEVSDNTSFKGKKIVRWTIANADESETYEMTVTFKNGKTETITLEYDRQAQCWTAYNK